MTSYKFNFPWYCPGCGVSGNIYFGDDVDIWLILQKIAENHSITSPTCEIWWSYLKTGVQNVLDTK